MRYRPIDPGLFIHNRKKLINQLHPNSLAIFHANDLMPSNADGTMAFVQNSDLFYLSGIDQAETILLLYPDAIKAEWREILFIKETNESIAIWEGNKYGQEEASGISGITTIHWTGQFEEIFHSLMGLTAHLYLCDNEHARANYAVETRNRRFISWVQARYPLHRYERIAPMMHTLRSIKEETEIALIQEACMITSAGFQSVLSAIRPGIMEYELEALFSYEFLRRGSGGFAFEPIIASGRNSCILHYTKNNAVCPPGEILLLDVGATYANYSADVTRVVPINGRFTSRQRQVYEALLHLLYAATSLLRPGVRFSDYHKEVISLAESALLSLDLIDRRDLKNQPKSAPVYKKYFMHSISHHLGLSTHDVGNLYGTVTENMVLTVEPGIYIQAEGIGMRLENDIVIRAQGIQNLTQSIPIELEAIEEAMQSQSSFTYSKPS